MTAWCGLFALALVGCGRLGFDALEQHDRRPSPRRDGGGTPGDGSDAANVDRDAEPTPPSAEAGVPGRDSGTGMDAAVDAGTRDAAADAALQDSASVVDAAPDTGPPDTGPPDTGPPDPPCAAPSAADFCTALPGLPAAPVIDGVLECGLTLQPVPVVRWTGNAQNPIPAGHSARMAWAWRPDGVYLFVDVDDATRLPSIMMPNVWCGDSLEVYADSDGSYGVSPMYDDPGTAQLIASAPANDADAVTVGERWRNAALKGAWAGSNYRAFPRPGGYVLEALIVAGDLDLASWSLAAGQRVGIDLSVNLSVNTDPPMPPEMADCGRRMGQYFMHVPDGCADGTCLPFGNVTGFCNPTLL